MKTMITYDSYLFCKTCNREIPDTEDLLETGAPISGNNPVCGKCGKGFFDDNGLDYLKRKPKRWILDDDIEDWIQSRQIDGTLCIANTEFLRGQKQGEMMMLQKILDAIKHTENKNE